MGWTSSRHRMSAFAFPHTLRPHLGRNPSCKRKVVKKWLMGNGFTMWWSVRVCKIGPLFRTLSTHGTGLNALCDLDDGRADRFVATPLHRPGATAPLTAAWDRRQMTSSAGHDLPPRCPRCPRATPRAAPRVSASGVSANWQTPPPTGIPSTNRQPLHQCDDCSFRCRKTQTRRGDGRRRTPQL